MCHDLGSRLGLYRRACLGLCGDIRRMLLFQFVPVVPGSLDLPKLLLLLSTPDTAHSTGLGCLGSAVRSQGLCIFPCRRRTLSQGRSKRLP